MEPKEYDRQAENWRYTMRRWDWDAMREEARAVAAPVQPEDDDLADPPIIGAATVTAGFVDPDSRDPWLTALADVAAEHDATYEMDGGWDSDRVRVEFRFDDEED